MSLREVYGGDPELAKSRPLPSKLWIEAEVFRVNVRDLSAELDHAGRHEDATAVRQAAKKLERRIR